MVGDRSENKIQEMARIESNNRAGKIFSKLKSCKNEQFLDIMYKIVRFHFNRFVNETKRPHTHTHRRATLKFKVRHNY